MRIEQIWALFSFENFRRMVLLLTGLIALLVLVESIRFLPVTDENVHTEPAYVVSVLRWMQGAPLYSDFHQPPYLITPFPPFWYMLMALAYRLGVTSIDGLTLVGRLLSLGSLLAIAFVSYLWNRQRDYDRLTSLLTPAFYLTIPLLIPMAVIARQDLLALLFSFLAVFLVSLRPKLSFVVLGGVFAVLAYLTKHSSVAAPTVIVLWLLSFRRWKQAVAFCITWGVIVLPVMLYFQHASAGTMMMNLSGSKFGPFGIKNLHDILVHLLAAPGAQVMLALFGFALPGLFQPDEPGDEHGRLLKIYFLVSVPLALFASGFANATANHFLEPALVWALLVPSGVNALANSWQQARAQAILIFSLTLVLLIPTLDVQLWSTRNERPDDVRSLTSLVNGRRILSDVTYFGARSANPEFLDPISLTFSEKAGAWSSRPITQAVQARDFELVVLHWRVDDPRWETVRYPRLPASMRSAIAKNYGLCFESHSDFFYAPKDSVDEQRPRMCPQQPLTASTR
jgi:hypothetical protein